MPLTSSVSKALSTTASPGTRNSEKTGTAINAKPNPENARIRAANSTPRVTKAICAADIDAEEKMAKAFVFDPGIQLTDIVDAINAVGATPSDLVAILEALKVSGALRAQLIII